MTPEEIQAMGPKELAEMTAAHVMGWIIISEREDLERRQTANYVSGRGIIGLYGNRYIARSDGRSRDWNPGEDISAAWEVLEHLKNKGAEINIGFYEKWDCDIDYPIGCNWREVGETAPEAICKAALLAVLGEGEV